MNINEAAVAIRQRSMLEVIDLGFRFSFSLGGRLYLKLLVPLIFAGAGFASLALWLDFSWWFTWFCVILFGGWIEGVFTIAAGRLMFAADISAKEIWGQFWRRLGAYSFALIGRDLMHGLGALVIVGFPFLWVRYAFLREAILLEGATPGEGFKRAGRFVMYHGGNTFSMLLAHTVMTVCIVLSVELLGQAVVNSILQLGTPVGEISAGGSMFAVVGYFLSLAIVGTSRFLAYIDARTRRDGWDVQVSFMALRADEVA